MTAVTARQRTRSRDGETFTDNIRADEAWVIADSSSDCLDIFGVNGSDQITINP